MVRRSERKSQQKEQSRSPKSGGSVGKRQNGNAAGFSVEGSAESLLLSMQQSQGNSAVQRYLENKQKDIIKPSPLSIQCEEDGLVKEQLPKPWRKLTPRELPTEKQKEHAVRDFKRNVPQLAELVDGLVPGQLNANLPNFLSPKPAKDRKFEPFRMAFPVPPEIIDRILKENKPGESPKNPKESGSDTNNKERHVWKKELWIIYENDGRGINPGGGGDQGPTAAFKIMWKWTNAAGYGRLVGVTVIDMVTPVPPANHEVPPGKKAYETEYPVKEPGPYSGVRAVHFGFTVYKGGGWQIDSLSTVGQDSPAWGKAIQDIIHRRFNAPLFPWRGADKWLAEQEIKVKHTGRPITDNFLLMNVVGRLEITGAARGGTRRTEAELGARFIMEKAILVGDNVIYTETSIGAQGRGFLRYNDGSHKIRKGIEGGFIGGIAASMGRYTLRLDYEDVQSMDPTKQTKLGALDLAKGQEQAPLFAATGKGGHRKGIITLIVRF